MNAPLPRKLGPYQLQTPLGQGGMGEVFRAYDERLDRHVAVKKIRFEMSNEERSRARFRREARTVARLNHPAIVQVFDLIEEEDGDWIVMELLEGRTLAEQLRRGPISLAQGVHWAAEIALALAVAHEKNVVHRDLKPSNVFVTEDGQVKILDFGLAKQISGSEGVDDLSISLPGAVVGTGSAMSPEQARGLAVDHRSDLFSLGTLLYRLLTGSSPFQADTLADTLSRVLHHQPESLRRIDERIPRELSDLVNELHEKSPELRPASARTVAERLRNIAAQLSSSSLDEVTVAPLSESTILAAPSSSADEMWTEPPTTVSSKRRNQLLAGGGILLLLTVGLTMWGTNWTTDSPPQMASPEAPEKVAELAPYELYRKGLELLERYDQGDNIEQATAIFQRILVEDEDSAPAYVGLAQASWWRFRSSNRDPAFLVQAQSAAQKAVELEEHLADARVIRGLVSLDQGRLEEAEADFQTALAFDPTHAGASFGMAEMFNALGRLEEAEAAFLQALEAAPEDRRLYDDLGALYFKTGRYSEAEAMFRKSIELVPDAILGRRNLSSAYYMQGRYGEAAKEVQEALKIKPSSTLYSSLGTLLFVQGLYPAAVSAFEKALGFSHAANEYLYWANLADAYRWTLSQDEEARNAYQRAIQLLREEVERQPENPTPLSRLALYLAKRGDLNEALLVLDRLQGAGELDASTLYRIAVVHEVSNRRQEALETLSKALDAGFSPEEVRQDPELIDLRGDPKYHLLLVVKE